MIPETLRRRRARASLLVASALASIAFVAALPGSGAAATTTPTFAPPVYVDQHLAGGEPEVFADTLHGRLIYSSHEGTTHLYRDGITNSPWGDFDFVSNYCNQVNTWTSPDGGVNWFVTGTSARPARRTRRTPGSATQISHRTRAAASTTPGSTSPTTRSSRRWTEARRGTRGRATATTETGRGSPAASPTRCSWAPTRSRETAAAIRSTSRPTAATRAARWAFPTTARWRTAARGRRSGSSSTTG